MAQRDDQPERAPTPPDEWKAFCQRVAEGDACDLTGFGIVTGEQIEELVLALVDHGRVDNEGRTALTDFDAGKLTFEGDVNLSGVTFQGNTDLSRAVFQKSAWLYGATFEGDTRMSGATFQGSTDLSATTFDGNAWLGEVEFRRSVDLSTASFKGNAWLPGVTFHGTTNLSEATFRGYADLSGSTFRGDAALDGAFFASEVGLNGTRFEGYTTATLRMEAHDATNTEATTEAIDETETANTVVDLTGAKFLTSVQLGSSDPARPIAVSSLDRADVSGLELLNTDLRTCTFGGVSNLDAMGLGGRSYFKHRLWWHLRSKAPQAGSCGADAPTLPPPSRVLRARDRICQEEALRGKTTVWKRVRLMLGRNRYREDLRTEAQDISKIYRNLRKGREDRKNEPGAADFYYGEMEMRRYGDPLFPRWVVAAYWAVSGYSLRPIRPIVALVLVTLVAALVLMGGGFVTGVDDSFEAAWQFSLGATVNVLTFDVNDDLTLRGKWVQIALRILGPTLYLLIVLAFRGRVKR